MPSSHPQLIIVTKKISLFENCLELFRWQFGIAAVVLNGERLNLSKMQKMSVFQLRLVLNFAITIRLHLRSTVEQNFVKVALLLGLDEDAAVFG